VFRIYFLLLVMGFYFSCQSDRPEPRAISTDPALIAAGQRTFAQDCSPCHNFRQDGIGPNLAGITREVSADWIARFIRNSPELIDGGDERARKLFDKYHVYMPPFGTYSDAKMEQLIAYLHTFDKPVPAVAEDSLALSNPIEKPIENSGIVVDMEFFTQIPFSSDEMPRTRIVKMDHIPGSRRLFVADLRGQLYEIINQEPQLVLDLNDLYSEFIHKPGLATGFGSFAFHPEFLQNGLLYVSHTEPPGTAPADFSYADSIKVTLQWVLTELKINNPAAWQFEVISRELFRIDMVTGIHGMQEIAFRPDVKPGDSDFGKLFIGIGDGGSAENGYIFLADNPGTVWSSILRIDPLGSNSKNGHYGIPEDNPFVQAPNKLPEVYAYGFRNPHRLTWDAQGRMLATCIGHHRIEEVNLILPGKNYGWPYREGTFVLNPYMNMSNVYPLPGKDETEYTYPIAQYDHEEGNAISGGYGIISDALPELKGKYIFGDIVRGRLLFINSNEILAGKQANVYEWRISLDGQPSDLVKLTGTTRVDLRFGRDAEYNIYIMTKADGKIYRLGRPAS
jgi:glucose/arabinose dehydrogenase/mono/diheme cytochrome c family protein